MRRNALNVEYPEGVKFKVVHTNHPLYARFYSYIIRDRSVWTIYYSSQDTQDESIYVLALTPDELTCLGFYSFRMDEYTGVDNGRHTRGVHVHIQFAHTRKGFRNKGIGKAMNRHLVKYLNRKYGVRNYDFDTELHSSKGESMHTYRMTLCHPDVVERSSAKFLRDD